MSTRLQPKPGEIKKNFSPRFDTHRRHPEPVLAKNTESLGIKAITWQVRYSVYYVRYRLDIPATAFGHSFWPQLLAIFIILKSELTQIKVNLRYRLGGFRGRKRRSCAWKYLERNDASRHSAHEPLFGVKVNMKCSLGIFLLFLPFKLTLF